MALSPAAPREHIHTRRIELQGYRRDDGLWDIEAHLTDCKGYPFENRWRGRLEPGAPVHDMWLRLTVDDGFTIRAVEAVMDANPFPSCPEITSSYQQLVGLQLGPGWIKQARQRVGRTAGCTHLSELLGALATAAFQTIAPLRKSANGGGKFSAPLVDSCHGWRSGGEAALAMQADAQGGE